MPVPPLPQATGIVAASPVNGKNQKITPKTNKIDIILIFSIGTPSPFVYFIKGSMK
jgi:hypothetical protein